MSAIDIEATSSTTQVLDGTTYDVHSSMIRKPRPKPFLLQVVYNFLAIFLGTPTLILFGPPIYLILGNKTISQRFAAILIPAFMPLLDKAYSKVKIELLKELKGKVLDVGCGDGSYLKYFEKASSITELEPNPNMIPRIQANVEKFKRENPHVQIHVVNKFVNELDKNDLFDYVVFGNVMCEVPNQKQFLLDINEVLKPGGKIVFIEHVRAPRGSWMEFIQDTINPFWCRVSDGCNCNRDTESLIRSIPGWNVASWKLSSAIPILPMIAGIVFKAKNSSKM